MTGSTLVQRPGAGFGALAGRFALHAVVIVFMAIWFTPILGLFVSSVRSQSDMATSGWWTVFVKPLLTGYNFQQAIFFVGVIDSGLTSLVIAVPVTIATTVISAVGAYALTRMNVPGRRAMSLALVALLVVPPQVTIVTLIKLFIVLGVNGAIPAVW